MLRKIIVLTWFFIFSKEQLQERIDVCSDAVTYQCVTEIHRFQAWDIQRNSLPLHTWAAVRSTPIGVNYTEIVGESNIIAEVISKNGSHFTSSLTITGATSLIHSIVTCNGNQRDVRIDSSRYLPSSVTILVNEYQEGVINVTASWIVTDFLLHLKFIFNIEPPLENGDTIWNDSEPSTTFMIRTTAVYLLNISICNDNVNIQFEIGSCQFFTNSYASYYYNISKFGNTYARQTCKQNCSNTVYECGEDGQWKNLNNVLENKTTTFKASTTEEQDNINSFLCHNHVILVTSSNVTSCIVGFILGCLSIWLCTRIYRWKKNKYLDHSTTPAGPSDVPVYEDIQRNYDKMELSHNVAYEVVHRDT